MILDQQTYDRLNAIERGIEALWKTTDDIFETFNQLYTEINEIEATIARLVEAVGFLERTAFPEIEVTVQDAAQPDTEPPEEAVATVEANVGKDKTNGPSKEKPKAKKKTVRKTS